MKIREWPLLACLAIISACSESPSRHIWRLSSPEPAQLTPLRPGGVTKEELSQCPNLNGKFDAGDYPSLRHIFRLPIPDVEHYAQDLLTGRSDGEVDFYSLSDGERFTIEIRHTGRNSVWLVVRSSTGRMGEGEAIFFDENRNTCRGGVLYEHASTGTPSRVVNYAVWVDKRTGDILSQWQGHRSESGLSPPTRFKRLSQ